jgi:hypothetical protein
MGAACAAHTFKDEASFGDYFQWGRGYDGHESASSELSYDIAASDSSFSDKFIISNEKYDYHWSKDEGNDLWKKNCPCPEGFRIPTIKELYSELIAAHTANNIEAFENFLKLPSAGYKEYYDGIVKDKFLGGSLWSCDIKNNLPQAIYFYKRGIGIYESFKANGHSVRCIKE